MLIKIDKKEKEEMVGGITYYKIMEFVKGSYERKLKKCLLSKIEDEALVEYSEDFWH